MKIAKLVLIVAFLVVLSANAAASDDFGKTVNEISSFFSGYQNVKVKSVEKVIFIEGEVGSLEALNRIDRFSSEFSSKAKLPVVNMTCLTREAKGILAEQLTLLLTKTSGIKGVSVSTVGNSFHLEGTVSNEYEADRAVAISQSFLTKGNTPLPRSVAKAEGELRDSPNRFLLIDMMRISPSEKKVSTRKK